MSADADVSAERIAMMNTDKHLEMVDDQVKKCFDDAYDGDYEYEKKVCPVLLALMVTETKDGSKRKTTTVTFYADQGRLGCCVHDRHQGAQMHLRLTSLEDVWDEIESALVSGEGRWRKSVKPAFRRS